MRNLFRKLIVISPCPGVSSTFPDHHHHETCSVTYPQRVPKIRFIMKKAPINTSVTKYNQGQVGLVVSLI